MRKLLGRRTVCQPRGVARGSGRHRNRVRLKATATWDSLDSQQRLSPGAAWTRLSSVADGGLAARLSAQASPRAEGRATTRLRHPSERRRRAEAALYVSTSGGDAHQRPAGPRWIARRGDRTAQGPPQTGRKQRPE
ncbi:hypothetical protein EJ04DRAFT_264641 [Polyplosphaeria fusca]|uniref:Uncharacterized protein n=1 Tax=Polyplosphaeria fusca TaxID=682080 RepID=A0A9P4RAS4_9PLEO|nr:hypothetical protein EJ04DRAFT_264641 [Polyplosphaeria fusca]